MSIRQRLYPNPENEVVLVRHLTDSRFDYNLSLEQRNFWRKQSAQKITYITQARELAEVRKSFSWLAEGSSVVQQAALLMQQRTFLPRDSRSQDAEGHCSKSL